MTPGKTVYTCPMHPDVVSDKPGNCPKCNMRLQRRGGASLPAPQTTEKSKSQKTVYWCPMHTEVTSTDPNATCPKCGGMKLMPKES